MAEGSPEEIAGLPFFVHGRDIYCQDIVLR
jgi:hypothetical protein